MTDFTPAQQAAIEHHGHDILVSASAGSGKTTVLVERIINEVLAGINLDRLLVVTFTDAAAAEMRGRIRQAIENQLANASEAQQIQFLRQQLNLLGSAQISTLHAFCLQVIRKFYYVLQLDPSFRLLTDQTEHELLMEKVWQNIRDHYYDLDDPDFFALADQFGSDRSDQGLAETVFQLYQFAVARPNSQAWLAQIATDYQTGDQLADNHYFQQWLRPYFREQVQQIQDNLRALLTATDQISNAEQLVTLIEQDLQLTQHCLNLPAASYADFKTVLTDLAFPAQFELKGRSKANKELYATELPQRQAVKDLLERLKKECQQPLVDDFFFADEALLIHGQQATAKILATLTRITQEFMTAYQAEKQRLKALDFSDLEQLTWQLLTWQDETGYPVRNYYQQQFHEVLVDEYQDINPLQEAILQAVAQRQPGNLFMVGDVKQSIYGFRQADPSKFLEKYQQFKAADHPGERIILAENFRSTANINHSTNFIFQQIMHHDFAELDYDQDAQLVTGATDYPSDLETTTELLLYDQKSAAAITTETPEFANNELAASQDKKLATIRLMGLRLKQMVEQGYQVYQRGSHGSEGQKRPATYSDFAILVPTRQNNLEIVSQFQTLQIPIFVKDANDFFQTTEIQIMLALLRIINNPEQDIPLVTVLRSPIASFDENDLAAVRSLTKTGNFYHALRQVVTTEVEVAPELQNKVTKLLAQLQGLREYAVQHSIAELIWHIYQTTGYLDYVGGMPGGLQRSLNLQALYQRAFSYEQTSFKGLSQFIDFIEQMQQHDQDLAQAQVGTADQDAVQLMTIHGSKGLEFPIVFIFDIDHRFNMLDLTQRKLILDGQYGLGTKYLDLEQRVKYPTLINSFVRRQHQQALIAEEMRKLYVAMTRAKQKLLLVGAVSDWERDLDKYQLTDGDAPTTLLPLRLRQSDKLNSFLQMILPAVLRSPALKVVGTETVPDVAATQQVKTNQAQYLIHLYQLADLIEAPVAAPPAAKASEPTSAVDAKLQTTIEQLFNFQYPYQTATQTTAYQSVSEIKQAFADPDQFQLSFLPLATGNVKRDSAAAAITTVNGRYLNDDLPKPKFLMADQTITGAQIGTATHLLLQRVDLSQAMTIDYLSALRQSLVDQGLLEAAVAAKIDLPEVQNFFGSELGQALQDPVNQVAREVPFSLLLPAQAIFEMPDEPSVSNLLVHGIMDGYLIGPNGVTLFDYKTDSISAAQKTQRLAQLTERYRGQINLYGQALSNILQQPVTHKFLYFLSANQLVEL
ncbi:helicase-exonuclease AddAB subunit AddA [Lapidilactobacillus wuchangensis]|uniref:helicase-exonuclease AddAB subunit AddA n=1 Tax=Lapidilactobacillus wuchangensis TaxID=2486001 RepID=UPI000F797E91|nr:helicase-exonuclease AddAB subunit AddA [Lapidilactobacillus wuchangensis]